MLFFVDNLWFSGPNSHSNLWSPSRASVLVALHSPGCHLVLFTPVYHLYGDFLHLLPLPVARPPPVYLPRAAPIRPPAGPAGPAPGCPSSPRAPQAEGQLWEAPKLQGKQTCCSLWSLCHGSHHGSISYFSHLVLEGQAITLLRIWKGGSLPWQLFQCKIVESFWLAKTLKIESNHWPGTAKPTSTPRPQETHWLIF